MKKFVLAVVAVLICGTVLAQTEVYSVNVVGFQRGTLRSNNFVLAGMPFIAASNSIQDVVGNQLTANNKSGLADNMHFWDTASQGYRQYYLKSSANATLNRKWVTYSGDNVSTQIMPLGTGYWIDGNQANITQRCVVAGDVASAAHVTNWIVRSLQLITYPFAAEVAVSNLTFQNALANNKSGLADNIHFWDVAAQTYRQYYYKSSANAALNRKWVSYSGDLPASNIIAVGEGFWYQSRQTAGTTNSWVQARPYSF